MRAETGENIYKSSKSEGNREEEANSRARC